MHHPSPPHRKCGTTAAGDLRCSSVIQTTSFASHHDDDAHSGVLLH